MNPRFAVATGRPAAGVGRLADPPAAHSFLPAAIDRLIEQVAPCPWVGHAGGQPLAERQSRPLYTPDERRRRDASPWTLVQGVLAPLQFLAFAVSLFLIVRYLMTGEGLALATGSVLIKTGFLYAIMVTGSVWEKEVFGRWLFAETFFWEDVFSMLVLALQTAYVAALLAGWGSPRDQLMIAVAAYAAYAVNATQFLLKLRAARMEGALVASARNLGAPDLRQVA